MQQGTSISAAEARNRLEEGNLRFISGRGTRNDLGEGRRAELSTGGQHPFAVVVGCSDSRVPPEVIFDQALGDIFVVRVAGNIMDEVALGSVEYGAEHLHTPLLVVLGHEQCGAVKATIDGGEAPGSIGAIVGKIQPAVAKARNSGASGHDLYEKATDLNILATVAEIKESPVIKELMHMGKLTVVGAKYHLRSGKVVFMD